MVVDGSGWTIDVTGSCPVVDGSSGTAVGAVDAVVVAVAGAAVVAAVVVDVPAVGVAACTLLPGLVGTTARSRTLARSPYPVRSSNGSAAAAEDAPEE